MAKRRAENWIAALPVLLALAACGTGSSSSTASTTGVALPPAGTPEPTPLTPSGGFIAMPSPQQVVEAQPHGRVDPFAPLPAAPTAEVAAPEEAGEADASATVQLTGVSAVQGMVRAFVSFNGQSGPVAPGDVGGPGLPWLPEGLSVAGIDVERGQLLLVDGIGLLGALSFKYLLKPTLGLQQMLIACPHNGMVIYQQNGMAQTHANNSN